MQIFLCLQGEEITIEQIKGLADVFTRLKWTSCRILELSKNQLPYLTVHKLATRHRTIGYDNIISYGKFYEIDIAWYYPSNRMTKDKIMKTNDSDAFRTFENFFGETEMI